MTPFARQIRELVALEGPLTVERYMGLCLAHYYASRDPLGSGGDFITAPEISQMFGELIGLWAAEVWRMMGGPDRVHWVELGPGRGTLSADALRAAQSIPAFREALDVHLVETSSSLRQRQKEALAGCRNPVTWHDAVDTLPDGPMIVVANEFFDALPVRQLVGTSEGWHERCVGLDSDGALCFGLVPMDGNLLSPPTGHNMMEIPAMGIGIMRHLADRVSRQSGAALVIDYGYAGPISGDSLQALRRHSYVDPLTSPGEVDLTTHVDFQYLASAAFEAGAVIHGLAGQGSFLQMLGIDFRASTLKKNARDASAIDIALNRLIGKGEAGMGELFKVMAISSPGLEELPGLARCHSQKLHQP